MFLHKLLKMLGISKGDESNQAPRQERNDSMVKPFRMRYVVKGTDHYVIEFRPQSDGAIKMFAINHPADPWGKTVVVHHLYTNGTICVAAGHEPRTADRARAIAQVWAAGWSSYIRTGTFPSGSQKVNIV